MFTCTLRSFVAHSVAVLLTVVLVACAGCRVMSPKTPPPTPPIAPVTQVQNTDETGFYTAFRPIMPGEQFAEPIPERKTPKIEPNPEVPNPEVVAAQSKVEELNRRITELETQLEEARQAPPPVVEVEPMLLPEKTANTPARSLPVINKQGVKVFADESQNVRIEIADGALFMPNAWQLTASGEETLRAIAAELRAYDAKSVLDIEGHTDSLVGDPSNSTQKHEVSSVKTKVIMDFFVNALRWDISHIGTSSFGHSRPIADNNTPEGRERNNRIEIVQKPE